MESIYESSLCNELVLQGLCIQQHVSVPVKYKDVVVRDPLCLDILVENKVIIEVKATERDHSIYHAHSRSQRPEKELSESDIKGHNSKLKGVECFGRGFKSLPKIKCELPGPEGPGF